PCRAPCSRSGKGASPARMAGMRALSPPRSARSWWTPIDCHAAAPWAEEGASAGQLRLRDLLDPECQRLRVVELDGVTDLQAVHELAALRRLQAVRDQLPGGGSEDHDVVLAV